MQSAPLEFARQREVDAGREGDKLATSSPERYITGRHLDARRAARLGCRRGRVLESLGQ